MSPAGMAGNSVKQWQTVPRSAYVHRRAKRLDDDEKGPYTMRTPGGLQEVLIVSERSGRPPRPQNDAAAGHEHGLDG